MAESDHLDRAGNLRGTRFLTPSVTAWVKDVRQPITCSCRTQNKMTFLDRAESIRKYDTKVCGRFPTDRLAGIGKPGA